MLINASIVKAKMTFVLNDIFIIIIVPYIAKKYKKQNKKNPKKNKKNVDCLLIDLRLFVDIHLGLSVLVSRFCACCEYKDTINVSTKTDPLKETIFLYNGQKYHI